MFETGEVCKVGAHLVGVTIRDSLHAIPYIWYLRDFDHSILIILEYQSSYTCFCFKSRVERGLRRDNFVLFSRLFCVRIPLLNKIHHRPPVI